MAAKNVTGVRVYVITVDEATNQVLKTEEEDPNTGKRAPTQLSQAPAVGPGVPAGFVPSVIIWVGGGVAVQGITEGAPGGQQFAPQTVIGQAAGFIGVPHPPAPPRNPTPVTTVVKSPPNPVVTPTKPPATKPPKV